MTANWTRAAAEATGPNCIRAKSSSHPAWKWTSAQSAAQCPRRKRQPSSQSAVMAHPKVSRLSPRRFLLLLLAGWINRGHRQNARTEATGGAGDTRYARHDPPLAPATDRAQVGLQPASAASGTTANRQGRRRSYDPHCPGESQMGLLPHRRHAGKSRLRRLSEHGQEHPLGSRHQASARSQPAAALE